ncbi:hypothetical protein [Microbacterium sp. SL75]|uniref:hypothetical protein n=1 Tax=Microbacterium sp. SL75 TaxID=2995140 RepID=UPI002270CB9E|nr:hypothetical protein [Microbacterium sp. SL75]WAC69029.1 hypothetical protein OVA17_15840 [Microbacterium sp. SL75]
MSEHANSAPLTPLQRAYLAARDGAAPLGATGMLDVRVWESDVDADRLREVVASLVARHEALRLRIDATAGTQSVAPEADVLRVVDLHGRGDDAFVDLLAELRTAPRPLDALVEVVHVRRDDRDAVVLCSDALALDGQGLARVISEARRLLADPTLSLPPAPTGLLDALRAFPAGADADRAQRAADDLPAAPRLPWRAALDGLGPIRTERTSRVVDAAIWRRAVLAGGAAGLSAHSVAAGAIGDELAARSGGPVRLSVPTAGAAKMRRWGRSPASSSWAPEPIRPTPSAAPGCCRPSCSLASTDPTAPRSPPLWPDATARRSPARSSSRTASPGPLPPPRSPHGRRRPRSCSTSDSVRVTVPSCSPPTSPSTPSRSRRRTRSWMPCPGASTQWVVRGPPRARRRS